MTDFPLPLDWMAPFDWECALWDPPVVRDDEVIVRAGSHVVGVSRATGRVTWKAELPVANLGGEVFLDGGDVLVCDVTVDRVQHLVAVTRSGVRWQRKLAGTVARNGALVRDRSVEAIVSVPRGGVHLVRFDLATGAEHKLPLPAGGSTLIALDDKLLVFSSTAGDAAPGAYVLDPSGTPALVFRVGDVWHGAVSGGSLLTVGGRRRDDYVVAVAELDGGAERWRHACRNDAGAIDGELVVHVVGAGNGETALVARAAADGAERWLVPLGDADPTTISFAGNAILVRTMRGIVVIHRDGHLLGEAEGAEGFSGTVGKDRVYVGGDHALLAARLP